MPRSREHIRNDHNQTRDIYKKTDIHKENGWLHRYYLFNNIPTTTVTITRTQCSIPYIIYIPMINLYIHVN